MHQFLQGSLQRYIENPLYRLPEFIPSNSIFLAQLWSVSFTGDIENYEEIFPVIFEEEVRRRIEKKKELTPQAFALKILDIDMSPYIEEARNSVLGDNSQFIQIFQDLKTQAHITLTPKESHKPISNADFKFTGRIEKLSQKALNYVEKIAKSMKKGGSLYRCMKLMQLKSGIEYNTLESIGLITNEQKLALILTSYRDHRNAERKEVINSGKFLNIFNPLEALNIVQEIYTGVVIREMLNYKSQLLAEMSKGQSEEKALQFATTLDLDEAAGLLYGIKQGSTDFHKFSYQLMKPSTNLPCQKLKMLTHGEYLGIKLVMDTIKNIDIVKWNPTKKYFNKLWTIYADKTQKEEWIDACPDKAQKIENRYLRNAGVFIPYSKPRSNVKDERHWEGKIKKVKKPKNAKKKNKKKINPIAKRNPLKKK